MLTSALRAFFPKITTLLIITNIIVFISCWYSGTYIEQVTNYQYLSDHPRFVDMVVAMFMHGSWDHLLWNMLFLYLVGIVVEPIMGRNWFLLSYILSGFAGHIMFSFMMIEPTGAIGASGAIFGVMGMYVGLWPLRLQTKKHWISHITEFILLALMGWFAYVTTYNALHEYLYPFRSSIANWAHVGGFAAGILLGLITKVAQLIKHPE